MKRDPRGQAGFTLMELVIVMVLIGIVSAYVLVLNANTAALSARSQADKLAADIRHVQALTMSWGTSLQISVDNTTNTYSVACPTGSTATACANSPVIDPATGVAFSTRLGNSVAFSPAPPSTISSLTINSAGAPSSPIAGMSYTLVGGGATFSVAVAPTTGTVSVSPP